MKITDIQLVGCSNALNWSIANKAELKDNAPLVSIINDDSCFSVVIEGLDFYQMFRLTQLYRNHLRIRNISRAEIPSIETLEEYFPKFSGTAFQLLNAGTGLVAQMLTDSDIIPPEIPQLFLPMITVGFTVQIPFAFVDAIQVMSESEVNELFTLSYRENLKSLPERGASHTMIRAIMIMIERSCANIRYETKYDQLLQITKYFGLKSNTKRTQPFKAALLNFGRYDPIIREQVLCSTFKSTVLDMTAGMEKIKAIKSPLIFSFAIQLPIYHMQILENRYSRDELQITHRSSINAIVDNGPEIHELTFNGSMEMVDNYRVRLTEMQYSELKAISDISSPDDAEYHPSALFAMLPPIYRTNAVITFKEDMIESLMRIDEPVISEMFREIHGVVNGLMHELSK